MTAAPTFVPPMELLPVTRLPEGPEWAYEVKLDGYRAQAIHGPRMRLLSRRGKDLSKQFPATHRALASAIPAGSIVDGELVALDADGRPDFQLIQNSGTSGAPVVFFAFDLLTLAGRDLRKLPLSERQQLLRDSLRTSDLVQLSESFTISAERILSVVRELGLEGVVAKRLDSRYEPGKRSGAWQKMRLNLSQEFVIGGYTKGDPFDAVLLGFYKRPPAPPRASLPPSRRQYVVPAPPQLMYCGSVRAGFVPATRRELFRRLKPLITPHCPFTNVPEAGGGRFGQGLTAAKMKNCTWVRPEVVAEFAFTEWTASEHLRHASFLRVRDDKQASDVVRET